MSFKLKNAGATHQRAVSTLFHDMMHQDVKVYVDDMIVKSRDMVDHLAALERFFERIRYTNLLRVHNQFADALATLAFMIDILVDTIVRLLLIELRSVPAYYCLIDKTELDDGLPWYHDIYHFLRLSAYPEAATAKDKRALR
ncbi:hypothetical protein VitviT2T_005373 [Vitis vinifera]|uniref:Reverse transcriptase domain-containing protein n=1 Tax=Vitis vinifera TaxID=29760 RepID=A0ABY9BSC8_VITVI|nr:hypothetical protein VitviT2T_005373 [Vitis vinifera]